MYHHGVVRRICGVALLALHCFSCWSHVHGTHTLFRSSYECTTAPQLSRTHCTFTKLAYFRGQLLFVVDNDTSNPLRDWSLAVPTSEYNPNVLHDQLDYERIDQFVLPVTEV